MILHYVMLYNFILLQAFDSGVISPLIIILTNIPNPSIQGRGCRLLGNLAKHDVKILKSIQENGAAKAICSILEESSNTPVLLMAIRLFKQIWDDKKFQNEIISLGGIEQLMKILLKNLITLHENSGDENEGDIDPTRVQIKTACGRNRTVTRQKFNYMFRDFDISNNTVEKITPEKKSYDNKFLLPEGREVLELINVIMRCFQIITSISASRIAEQLYSNCDGYLCLAFLADEDSPFRANALKVLSNLVSNVSARMALGSADVIILATNLLTSTKLKKPLDSGEVRYCIRIICLLTGDSCNRAKIRYSGALVELLNRARVTECEKEFGIVSTYTFSTFYFIKLFVSCFILQILYAFYQFRFDQVSTNLLVEKGLVPILIKRLSTVIVDMNVDHISIKVDDDSKTKDRQSLKRTRDLSPFNLNRTNKQRTSDYDPGSPGSSSGYGSGSGNAPLSPSAISNPRSVSPGNIDLDTDFDSDTYSPVCSDDEEGYSPVTKSKDTKDETVIKTEQTEPEIFDIFSYMVEQYDESLQFPPSDTEENDKSKDEKETSMTCLDTNFDFERKPVQPILMLLHNATITIGSHKYNMDLVRPDTLTTLLKLSQLVPKPKEKLLLILGNVLR